MSIAMSSCIAGLVVKAAAGAPRGHDGSDLSPLRKPAPAGAVVSARSLSENPAGFGRLNFGESSPVSLLGLAEAGLPAPPDGSTSPTLSRLTSRPASAGAGIRRAPQCTARNL